MNCQVFKALADENRIKILNMLSVTEMCACDISDRLEVGQSTVSHHMKQLVESNLVNMRKEGKWVFYSLNNTLITQTSDFFLKLISNDFHEAMSCGCEEIKK